MDFAATSAIVRSVLYSIAVMVEAAKGIGPAFKTSYPDIPWRAISVSGIRDRIVHEYFRTNTRSIWDVIVTDIDDLERALRQPGNGRTGGRR